MHTEETPQNTPSHAAPFFSAREEIANSISHGLGAVLSIAGLSVLVSMAAMNGDAWRIVGVTVYGVTLVALYLSSTLYHSFPWPRVKRIFRYFDHAAICLLIAGTYTPFTLVNMRGFWGWTIFGLIWTMAIAGILVKVLGRGRLLPVSVTLYLAMGWLVLIALRPAIEAIDPAGIRWLLIGGLAYTVGVLFFVWHKLPFNHAIWHLFVLAGSICHFFAVLFYAFSEG